MNILTVNEYPTYYLFEVNNLGSNTVDDYILDYAVSASNASSFIIPVSPQTFVVYGSTTGNTTGYFNSTTGIYSVGNTPNVTLYLTGSMLASGTGGGKFDLILNRQGTLTALATSNFTVGTPLTISASYYGLDGDQLYLRASRASGTPTLASGSFLITQSIAPSTAENDPIIIEPYISTPNYYNSDYNPLINNVLVDRLSTTYQDVDYSTGIFTPTNFDLLISGSALKAAVQDSNYTSKRVILPRYNGSKSTSQLLNTWTPRDEGTYGKTPTIDSLKTAVVYCDWIGGWPPEREGASAIHVLYLIKSDGTVVIPNTSENSLADIKGNFESGENILISSKTVSAGQPQQTRTVIRGGTRIEPILTNQSGSMPGGLFYNTITLTDNGVTGSVINDFQAKLRSTSYVLNPVSQSAFGEVCFNQILSTGSAASLSTTSLLATSYRYQVNSNILSEGISLALNAYLEATYTGGVPLASGNQNIFYQGRIVRWRGGNKTVLTSSLNTQITAPYQPIDISYSISFNDLQLNDEFAVEAISTEPNVYLESTSKFTINQTPIPNSGIPISNLWLSASGATTSQIQTATSGAFGTYLLFTTASALVNYYENPTVYQQDIPNSGFNPFASSWSVKYGDEFRFEGREDRLYQVKQAAVVNGAGLTKPLLVVEFNQPVPTSGSVNFDQFLIRRYVDDASQILMEGFKPIDSSGPYIVRPEYVAPELDKSVDQFILDLTQKGLII